MASIFNMYKDTASPDIYQEVRASRQESEDKTKKTQDTAFGMLKKSNMGTLQQEYREGSGRFKGITDPDKKFQVYYDALKAFDPLAAQDASKVYAEERQRRINREVSDAYKTQGSTGNADLDAIDRAIKELESSITTEDALNTQAKIESQKQEELKAQEEQAKTEQLMSSTQASGGLNPNIQTGRLLQSTPELTPDNENYQGDIESDVSKLGSVPLPRYDLQRLYGLNPNFDISLSRGQVNPEVTQPAQSPRIGVGTGMEGYEPYPNYIGYKPSSNSIANFYRGR